MPTLHVRSNASLDVAEIDDFLGVASSTVAAMLGKPESYVMVSIDAGVPMRFGGTAEPCAYASLASLGLPEDRTAEFSAALCALFSEHLGVQPGRTYIRFDGPPRHLFGWDGGTF